MIVNFDTFIKKYDVVDFGAYKSIYIQYNRPDVETKYTLNGSRDIKTTLNDTITIPSTFTKVRFFGIKRGLGATQTITVDLKYSKPEDVSYYFVTNKTFQNDVDIRNSDWNSLYFSDIDDFGYSETAFPRKIRTKDTSSYDYITIGRDFENRLDYVAMKYLGNPYHWWVIAEYNKIIDPFNVPAGTEIIIPKISEIYGNGGALRVPNVKLYQFY